MKASATSAETFHGKDIFSEEHTGCVKRYVKRYVFKNMPKSIFGKEGVMGNIIHETMKDVLNLGIKDDKTAILKLYYKYYESEFSKSGNEKLSDEEHESYKKKGKIILRDTIKMMRSRNFLRKPLMAEKWFNINLNENDGFTGKGKHYLIGKLDAAFETEKANTVSVVDYKTGKWVISEKDASRNIQMAAYFFVIKKIYRKESELMLAYPQKKEWVSAKISDKHVTALMKIFSDMSELDNVSKDDEENLEITPSRDNCFFCELKHKCIGGISIFGEEK